MQQIINKQIVRLGILFTFLLCALPHDAFAAMNVLGEYSYLHVSFSTIWHIFLFILILVVMPFIIMIFASWHRINEIKEEKTTVEKESDVQEDGGNL